jgi:hypothetical protein
LFAELFFDAEVAGYVAQGEELGHGGLREES